MLHIHMHMHKLRDEPVSKYWGKIGENIMKCVVGGGGRVLR
jgi:hypothetical protein